MGLNDIVVYVDSAEATKARVGFAVALAKEHGAHLIGIAFAPIALLPLYGADVGFADMSEVLESVKSQGAKALQAFEASAKAAGVTAEVRLMQGMSDEFPHDFARAARQADLAILGQPRDGDPLIGQYALVERCLFASGRPVIIVPASPEKLALKGVVVAAWDGSAEAARAINDAMTFLKQAARVVLVVGVTGAQDEEDWPRNRRHGGASEAAWHHGGGYAGQDRRGGYRPIASNDGKNPRRRFDGDGSLPSFPLARIHSSRRDTHRARRGNHLANNGALTGK